jgi:protein-S-isoprenylcysteine O-methyltransferase Ste14
MRGAVARSILWCVSRSPRKPVSLVLRGVMGMVVYGAVLFGMAGTAAWPAAWAYLLTIAAVLIAYLAIVTRRHPDLLEERHKPPADAKRWDRLFVAVIAGLGPAALIVVSGLDRRLGWSPPTSTGVTAGGVLLVAAGGTLTNYAVAVNRFFSALVRIQHDRGHQVVDAGPYRVVRHPGSVGSVLATFGAALALGSRWGLLVAGLVTLVIVVRTSLEDRTLRAELEGYAEYAGRVRFRLVPGVW